MLKALWTWISKENTRSTLTWLGGAVVAIVGALWKLYTHEPAAEEPAVVDRGARTDAPAQPTQTATADNGGIAINAEGNAHVSVDQSKQ